MKVSPIAGTSRCSMCTAHLGTPGGPPWKDFDTLHVRETAGRVNLEFFFISYQNLGTDEGVLHSRRFKNEQQSLNCYSEILWQTLAKSLSRLIAEFHFVLIIMLINAALLVKGQIMILLRTHTAAGFCSGCLKMPAPRNSISSCERRCYGSR